MRTALILCLLTSLGASACARRDRCYVEPVSYLQMKTLFEETGSLQRVKDTMKDNKIPGCEQREILHRLRADLFLKPEDFAIVPPGQEPVIDPTGGMNHDH